MSATIRQCFLAVACVALVALTGCQTAPKPTWDLPPEVKTLPVNGYPMAYVERGSGPTLVFVHGGLNDYRYWTPQIESLSPRFRIVSVSLRHYYPERWNGVGKFSIEQHADDLKVFIDGLNAGPIFLVAHSRGGPVVVRTTRSRPDLVRKLVLMDPGLFELLPAPSGAQKANPRIRRAKAAEEYFKRGEIEGGLEYYVDDNNGPGAWKKLSEDGRRIRRENAWTIVGTAADEASVLSCTDIGNLKMPVLLMTGERSPRQYGPILEAFQRCQPAATRATIPNAAHQMNQMNPSAFDAALVKFLSG